MWAQSDNADIAAKQDTPSVEAEIGAGAEADRMLGVPPEPAKLLGLGPSDVRQLFGDPDRVDDVPPALSWRFVAVDCALDLIFYEAVTTRNLRVLTYDVTSTNEGSDADARCLRNLLHGDG